MMQSKQNLNRIYKRVWLAQLRNIQNRDLTPPPKKAFLFPCNIFWHSFNELVRAEIMQSVTVSNIHRASYGSPGKCFHAL